MLKQWYDVVLSTQSRINTYIPVDTEWYVVNMLSNRVDLEQWPVIAYAQLQDSKDILNDLRKLADSGLIMPSIFPKRCKKLNIDVNWYYGVSRTCFCELYERGCGSVYESILDNFDNIKLILVNMLTNK